jgi:hypothetical protein
LKCYDEDSKECCDREWCDKCTTCVNSKRDCCECDDEHVYIEDDEAPPDSYDKDRCCPAGSTHFSEGDKATGCCKYVD